MAPFIRGSFLLSPRNFNFGAILLPPLFELPLRIIGAILLQGVY